MKRGLARIPLRIWVGQAVRRRRKALDLTQAEFAKRIEMDRTYYAMIESGKKNMQLDTLEGVCCGLKVRPSEILATAEADADADGATAPKSPKTRKKRPTRPAK